MKILVTGSAGFIGYHVSKRLTSSGITIVGVDSLTNYYDVKLKQERHKILSQSKDFIEVIGDLSDISFVSSLFKKHKFDYVIHLAAQPGVRTTFSKVDDYINSNIIAFINILKCSYSEKIKNLFYASSSSVYGNLHKKNFSENDGPNPHQNSFYAATKASNEFLIKSFSKQFKIRNIGFRFFTVYGPWGRPDMAYFKFYRKIKNGELIDVFNTMSLKRDMTYIDDIVDGVCEAINLESDLESGSIFNLGNSQPIETGELIDYLAKAAKKPSRIKIIKVENEVESTNANITFANQKLGYNPKTSLKEGITKFCTWYDKFYV